MCAYPCESLRSASRPVCGARSRRNSSCLLPNSADLYPSRSATARIFFPSQVSRVRALRPLNNSFLNATSFGVDYDRSGLDPSSSHSHARSPKILASRHSSGNFSRQRMTHHHQHHHYWDDWVEREDLQAMWQCPEVRQQWQARYNEGGAGKVPFRTVTSAGRVVPVLTIEGEWQLPSRDNLCMDIIW